MDNIKIEITDENCKSILAYENKTSSRVALAVLEKPAISAWMILIPIIILPFMLRHQRYKASTKIFCEGYLYTKEIAFGAAYQLFQNKISFENAQALIKRQVEDKPDTDPKVLSIYQKQMEEIEVLFVHYLALLATQKEKYWDMVVSHYQTKNRYLSFINKLADAEKEVSQAVSTTFQDESGEAYAVLEKMENYLLELRTDEANLIFLERV